MKTASNSTSSTGILKFKKNALSQESLAVRIKKHKFFYIMMAPGIIFFILFRYAPILGIRIAFWDYGLLGPKEFIGFQNFIEMFQDEYFFRALGNTLLLSSINLFLGVFLAAILALLLNEVKNRMFRKLIQTLVYLPHFISWVVVASIFHLILSPQSGFVNAIIRALGGKPVYFLASESWWRVVYIFIVRWRETGWGTVIFMAALSHINPQLYEASRIDGASGWQQMLHVTLPHLKSVMILLLIIGLSRVLMLFHSVFVLYNPLVYKVSDVLGTYVYRRGFSGSIDYDFATAVGLFRSLVASGLVLAANFLSRKYGERSIF